MLSVSKESQLKILRKLLSQLESLFPYIIFDFSVVSPSLSSIALNVYLYPPFDELK
jgi:hypothetical protein